MLTPLLAWSMCTWSADSCRSPWRSTTRPSMSASPATWNCALSLVTLMGSSPRTGWRPGSTGARDWLTSAKASSGHSG
jgi:hypothetical protein